MVQWVKKYLYNDQHGRLGPLRLVHLHRWWLPILFFNVNILRHSNVYKDWC